jgi:hypothetical protein
MDSVFAAGELPSPDAPRGVDRVCEQYCELFPEVWWESGIRQLPEAGESIRAPKVLSPEMAADAP